MNEELYLENEAKDGYMPCCNLCHKPFEDGDIGEVKNYPEDGLVSVFFECKTCKEESSFCYKPYFYDSTRILPRISKKVE